jgi:hypothetical protein
VGANFSLGTRLSWSNSLQYDNVLGELGWNSRLRFTIDPDNDLYIVVRRSFIDEDAYSWSLIQANIIVKCGWTLSN